MRRHARNWCISTASGVVEGMGALGDPHRHLFQMFVRTVAEDLCVLVSRAQLVTSLGQTASFYERVAFAAALKSAGVEISVIKTSPGRVSSQMSCPSSLVKLLALVSLVFGKTA